jgi:hypothetical protein
MLCGLSERQLHALGEDTLAVNPSGAAASVSVQKHLT